MAWSTYVAATSSHIALLVLAPVSLLACGKSRADTERERAAAVAEENSERDDRERQAKARAEEQAKRVEDDLVRSWSTRQHIIRESLADATRLGAAYRGRTALVYQENARANLDLFTKTKVAATQEWIDLDALSGLTRKQLDDRLTKPAHPSERRPDDRQKVLARHECHDGAMVKQVTGFDACVAAQHLEVCKGTADEDTKLSELATVGCARVRAYKSGFDVCCKDAP